jgi:predicted NBD/HSP70 family sugar kinase
VSLQSPRGPGAMPASRLADGNPRDRNIGRLLNIVWSRRTISRADIARVAELSRSTVSAIVNELLDMGLVEELGTGDSRGGRKPILLGFRDDAYLIAGVDLGATHVGVTLTDLGGTVLVWREVPCKVRDEPERAMAEVVVQINACLLELDEPARLLGVGVAAPCPVSIESHELSPFVLPRWQGVDLIGRLRKAFGVPVLVDNDANLGALAEAWWGKASESNDLTYIKLGFGIGAGQILGGDIYRGAAGYAGELGHMSLDPNGPHCECGLRGCLVTMAGGEALLARAKERIEGGAQTSLTVENLSVGAIVRAAAADDPMAIKLVEEVGEYLSIAVVNLVHMINPRTVVFGGQLSLSGERLLGPIRQRVTHRALGATPTRVRVMTSQLGPEAIALGAATLVLESALRDPTIFPERSPAQLANG